MRLAATRKARERKFVMESPASDMTQTWFAQTPAGKNKKSQMVAPPALYLTGHHHVHMHMELVDRQNNMDHLGSEWWFKTGKAMLTRD